jgi:hypothetical protein
MENADSHLQVNIATELRPISGVAYGINGYRSDCRITPFNGIVTFDHSTNQNAWFLQQSGTTFTLAASTNNLYFLSSGSPPLTGVTGTFQRYGLWTGYGSASGQSYSYQFGACASTIATTSAGGLGVGLFLSGLIFMSLTRCNCTRLHFSFATS